MDKGSFVNMETTVDEALHKSSSYMLIPLFHRGIAWFNLYPKLSGGISGLVQAFYYA